MRRGNQVGASLIEVYQNRVIYLKYEKERRKSIIERKVLSEVIKYAKTKIVITRPPDSQELNDMF